jgi:hypothetical protein
MWDCSPLPDIKTLASSGDTVDGERCLSKALATIVPQGWKKFPMESDGKKG